MKSKTTEKEKLELIIYVDAGHHKWVVAAEEIGLIDHGSYTREQLRIDGEVHAILQGVRWAVDQEVGKLRILTNFHRLSDKDNYETETTGSENKSYRLAKRAAKRIARENNLELELEWLAKRKNLAQQYLLREIAKENLNFTNQRENY